MDAWKVLGRRVYICRQAFGSTLFLGFGFCSACVALPNCDGIGRYSSASLWLEASRLLVVPGPSPLAHAFIPFFALCSAEAAEEGSLACVSLRLLLINRLVGSIQILKQLNTRVFGACVETFFAYVQIFGVIVSRPLVPTLGSVVSLAASLMRSAFLDPFGSAIVLLGAAG